jgi:hypothetical protein
LYPLVSDKLFRELGAMTYSYAYGAFTYSLILSMVINSYGVYYLGLYQTSLIFTCVSLLPLLVVSKIEGRIQELEKMDNEEEFVKYTPL